MKDRIIKLRDNIRTALNMDSKNFQLLLNVILIVVINLAAAAFSVKIDMTSSNTYSLTKHSREIVSNLNEKLKIKVFFSKDLAGDQAIIFRYLKDILDEYNFYGNRNFSYEIINNEELESQARDYGLEMIQVREIENDQVKIRNVYMGVVIQHGDLIEKIDAVTSTTGLEFNITSRIEKMAGRIDKILKLKEPVMLTLYQSETFKKLPIDGVKDIEKLLQDAVAKANLYNYNKIQFRVIDPSKDKLSGLDAQYGIVKMKSGDDFFGLVMESGDKFVNLDLNVGRTIFGSYIITGMQNIYDRINNGVGVLLSNNLKIGYLRGHGGIPEILDRRNREGAGFFADILSDMYQLSEVDLQNEDIPSDMNLLIINGPGELGKAFSDVEKYKIDRFLMEGNSVLFFVNSFIESNMGGSQFMGNQPLIFPVSSGLEDMMAHYGIKINKNIVLDKNCIKLEQGQDYPLMPLIQRSELNRKNIITKYINSVFFVKVSSLELNENLNDKEIESSILISTSPQSWLMEGNMNFHPMFMTPPSDKSQMKSYPIAALISGRFDSFFKDKDIPNEIAASDSKNTFSKVNKIESTITSKKSKLIVVGSSDITMNGFIDIARRVLSGGNQSETFSNDILIHSMVDYLSGNTYVPEMKSKSLNYNPLIKTDDRTRFFIKIINMVLIPFFVVLTGLILWRRRITRKRSIQLDFSAGGSDEK
ncbi:MAG: Gldg family protein [Spirochaetes bacterium]|nr:Gldg family protein [Spirochaetota bacterium]